jgi:hypothetical protein
MRTSLTIRTLLAAAATLLLYGCASGQAGAPALTTATSQHPADWSTTHYAAYLANPDSCTPCHGSSYDPTQAGGTSGVSCFGCHHPSGPNHPSGWADPEQHGRQGAQAVYNSAAFSMQGMASCQVCHGTNYASGVGVTPSCLSCHTRAPHPDAPWGVGLAVGTPASTPNHDETDASNAPACYQCHASGSSVNAALGLAPVTPAAGAQPGCFNNTMCHGATNL